MNFWQVGIKVVSPTFARPVHYSLSTHYEVFGERPACEQFTHISKRGVVFVLAIKKYDTCGHGPVQSGVTYCLPKLGSQVP